MLTQFFIRFHVLVGLIACIPWIFQGLTGAILVFEPELDAFLNSSYAYVEDTGNRISFQEQIDIVRRERPDLVDHIYGLDIRELPGRSTLMLAKPDMEAGPKDGVRIFVDPYKGELLAVQGYKDSLMGKVYHFHRTFYLPTWGKWITSTSAILLMLTVLVGVWIYFKNQSNTNSKPKKLHLSLGFWFAPLVFIIAFNGFVVTYRFVITPLFFIMTEGEVPAEFLKQAELKIPENPQRITLDEAIEISKEAVPNSINGVVTSPVDPDHPIVVIRKKESEAREIGGTFVNVNPYTSEVMSINDFTDGSMGLQLTYFSINLHTGEWGGYFGEGPKLFSRILWLISALSLPTIISLGLLSWIKSRSKASQNEAC